VVPYKITWFRRGWVGSSQLIWAIVAPMPGHLMYIAGLEGRVDQVIKEARMRKGRATEPTDGRTKPPTAGLGSFADSFTDMD